MGFEFGFFGRRFWEIGTQFGFSMAFREFCSLTLARFDLVWELGYPPIIHRPSIAQVRKRNESLILT